MLACPPVWNRLFLWEKKNYLSLSRFPQKILVIFWPKILFCSLSKHKFLRKRVTCFADIFLLSREGLMTNTWAAVLKRISYIFSFFLLLKFNTTTKKGNESNPFAEHATACGAMQTLDIGFQCRKQFAVELLFRWRVYAFRRSIILSQEHVRCGFHNGRKQHTHEDNSRTL